MRYADAGDYGRIAKDGRRASEVVKEPNPAPEKNCYKVDTQFVEQSSIQ